MTGLRVEVSGETGYDGVMFGLRFPFLCFLCVLCCVAGFAPAKDARAAAGDGRILFIGNSFTYFNQMPLMLQGLAQASGIPLTCRMQAEGAATLQSHWDNPGQGKSRLESASWRYVVLQEQSSTPVGRADAMKKYAGLFGKLIREKGAIPVLFVTWGYREEKASGGVNGEMQKILTLEYARRAEETGALLVPVGPAWAACMRLHPKANLYLEDGQHPSTLGSYLTACVFYATLFRKSPVGLPGTMAAGKHVVCDIPAAQARALQQVAWETSRTFDGRKFLEAYAAEQSRIVSKEELKPKLTRDLTYDALVAMIGKPTHANAEGRTYQFGLRNRVMLLAVFSPEMKLQSASFHSEEGGGSERVEVK